MSYKLIDAITRDNLQDFKSQFFDFLRGNGEDFKNQGLSPAKYATRFLSRAVMHRSDNILEFLISQGADVNTSDSYGSLLHRALDHSRHKSACILIKNGADLTTKNSDGYTPLHQAVYLYSDEDLIPLMLEKGADMNAQGEDGKTPFGLAKEYNQPEQLEVFETHIRLKEAAQDRAHQENMSILNKTPTLPLKLKR